MLAALWRQPVIAQDWVTSRAACYGLLLAIGSCELSNYLWLQPRCQLEAAAGCLVSMLAAAALPAQGCCWRRLCPTEYPKRLLD